MRIEKLKPFCGALIGALIGVCIGFNVNQILSIVVGIVVGMVLGVAIVLLLKKNNMPVDVSHLPEAISVPELYKSYVDEIKSELLRRQYAARRLHTCEFWIQILNIYYSCFTAVIAIWGVSDKTNSLSIPSALLTVLVAILVTYANAQNCGNRARDLEANCRDIANTLTYFLLIVDKQDNTEINTTMVDFYKKLGDSESPSNVDRWRFEKSKLHLFYIILVSAIVAILFVAPFLVNNHICSRCSQFRGYRLFFTDFIFSYGWTTQLIPMQLRTMPPKTEELITLFRQTVCRQKQQEKMQ